MVRTINQAVAEHLVDIKHRDLGNSNVTPLLVQAAGDAIADVLLDHGYRLERSYLDGQDIVHFYVNPRTGEILDEVGFSLGLVDSGKGGLNLAVLLRTSDAQLVPSTGFCLPVRSARAWYQPMTNSATANDLIAGANKTKASFEWPTAA